METFGNFIVRPVLFEGLGIRNFGRFYGLMWVSKGFYLNFKADYGGSKLVSLGLDIGINHLKKK